MDIEKAAGVLLRDRKFLVTRTKGKDFFVSPGGKLESGETPLEALVRELHQELQIHVLATDLKEFGVFEAPAAGEESSMLKMHVFFVTNWEGDIDPASEIEEVKWINSLDAEDIALGSIFKHDVLPSLKLQHLID